MRLGEKRAPSCAYKRMRGLCEPVAVLELMPARARYLGLDQIHGGQYRLL